MAVLDLASFVAKWTTNGGSNVFRDAKPIIAADERAFAQDIADSFASLSTLSSTSLWKPTYVKAKTTSALGSAYTYSSIDGITRLTSNSNGSFDSQVGDVDNIDIDTGDSIIVSGESTSYYNGCYYLENSGSIFQSWVLRLRDDSNNGDKTRNAIYSILFGTRNGGKFFRQTQINMSGSIADIAYAEMPGFNKKRLRVTLTTSQILSANTSPVLLLSGGGSGSLIKVTSPVIIKYNYGSAAFATNTNFDIGYGTSSSPSIITGTVGGILTQTQNYYTIRNTALVGGPATTVENIGVYFFIASGNPTSGTGSTVTIEFEYEVIFL